MASLARPSVRGQKESMTDLNALLKDFFDNRLAYKQVYREKFEALLSAMVADIEALKARPAGMTDAEKQSLLEMIPARRGPGRPPKEEANG
jgi:hypothetical protein